MKKTENEHFPHSSTTATGEIRTTTTKEKKIPPHLPILLGGIKVYDLFYKITDHINASKFNTKLMKGNSIKMNAADGEV